MNITVELDDETPRRVRQAFLAAREIEIVHGDRNRIRVDGRSRDLILLSRPPLVEDQHRVTPGIARSVPRGAVGLVVASSIPEREREALEEVGLSWWDGRGAFHIQWPGVLVHVDRTGRRTPNKTTRPDAPGIGPAGIRALQVLLGDPTREWTIALLAHDAAISVGQAHNVFRALEQNRFVETHGRGPKQRRVITDYRAALDWLATIDGARRRPDGAATYLSARTGEELLTKLAGRARQAELPYAVTGAAAGQLLGVPVMTKTVVTHVRVAPLPAGNALDALGLERLDADAAGSGMNLELWTDTGELGTFGATDVGGIRVAPPIRVWLDIARQGGRGADAAQLFQEHVLDDEPQLERRAVGAVAEFIDALPPLEQPRQ